MTWHRRLGHPAFKTVVALSESGVIDMVITDLQAKILSLDACAACVAATHTRRAANRRASIWVASISTWRARWKCNQREGSCMSTSLWMTTLTLCTPNHCASSRRRLMPSNRSGQQRRTKLREITTYNARELSMGQMCNICEEEGKILSTTVPYYPASIGIAERTMRVLTSAVRAMLHDSDLPKFLWAAVFNTATYVHNRTPTKALGDIRHMRWFTGQNQFSPVYVHLAHLVQLLR
jgi:hypothetical protein